MKRIGIMGGTFNPIHLGHLIAAEEVRVKMNLEKVIFIPTGNPPHKIDTPVLDSYHRMEMVKLAIKDNKDFLISDIEVNRIGKTYSYDTLVELHNHYDEVEFCFIIGYDTLKLLHSWKNIKEVCTLCSFIVVKRNNAELEMLKELEINHQQFNANIQVVDIPNIEISSTDIRERLFLNKSIKYLVTEAVENHINQNMLYRGV